MISKGLVPNGGWYYMQGDIKIKEPTADALISAVYLHRRNNHLPIGDPEAEVLEQISQRTINHHNMEQTPTSLWAKFKSFAGSMLRSYTQTNGALVDQNTANLRALTCQNCHMNQKSDADCKTCGGWVEDQAIATLRPLVIGQRSVNNQQLLKSCGICGCDLKMIVWFPSRVLGNNEENINRFPTFCWQKDLNT